MKTFQFYTLDRKELGRIKVSTLKARDASKQIEYNKVSVYGLGDFLYDNLSPASVRDLVIYIARRHEESENVQQTK